MFINMNVDGGHMESAAPFARIVKFYLKTHTFLCSTCSYSAILN